MKRYKQVPLLSFLFFTLTACSHMNERIDNLPFRATKIQINKKLGQPFKIKRLNGMDHWIYKFVIEGRHYTRAVVIKDGILYGTGKIKPHSLKPF